MRYLIRWSLRHPIGIFLFFFSVSLLSALALPSLEIHVSPQALTIKGSDANEFHKQTTQLFGTDNIAILVVSDAELLEAKKLTLVRDAITRIEHLPYVNHTQSLFSVPHLRVEGDFVRTDPFLANFPQSQEDAEQLTAAALRSPFVSKNLLSDDGKSMAVNIYLDEGLINTVANTTIHQELDAAIQPLKGHFADTFLIGTPQIREKIAERILSDAKTIVPTAGIILFFTLLTVLRRASGILIPLSTASISVLWTLGLMAALGIPINVMTTIVPVLLIIIGSTEDIHLISEYYHGVESGYDRKRAVLRMISVMTLAVILTFFTSGLGFLATGLNPIQMVREFAVISASGLAINFLVTILLVPLILRFLGETKTTRGFSSSLSRIGLGEKMATFALNNRVPLAIVTGIFMLAAMLLSSGINVNNSYLQYFDEQSEIRREADLLHEKLSGLETFNIIVDGHIDGTFERVNYLNELVKIQNYLRDRPSFDFTLSVADYIATVNSTVNDSGDLELPEEDEVVESLLLFVKKEQLAHYVTEDFSRANIVVRHNLSASADLNRELSYLRNHIDSVVDKDLKTTITGSSILSSHASDFLAESQAKSLAFMLVVIFIVIAIMFVNVKAGLLAVIPNIFVAACLFGIMGALGIPLDTGTSTIAAIALGISVDHTMHFLVRYQKIAKTTKSKQEAITHAASIEFRPIAAATVSLAAGFFALTLSGFTPVQYFGALSATVMLLAFYSNFMITPVLLSYVRLITLWDILSVPMRRGLKTQCTLFKGMNEFQIRHVLALGKIENYPVNSVIYAASRREKQLFVLLKGQVLVNPREESQQALRDDGTTDRIFGTGSMIDGWPHQCHVEVTEESQILALDWDRLARIQRFRPRTGSILFKNLSVILARLVEGSNPTNTLSSAKESTT